MHEVAREDLDRPLASEHGFGDPLEHRAAPRHTLLIRSAKLIVRGLEYLCVVRDVSETGVSVRIFHPLPDCTPIVLEMQNADQFALELVWRKHDRAGFRFAEKVDVARIIELPSTFGRRPIRVRLSVPGVLTSGSQQTVCEVLDISQHGAKLSCSHQFAVQQRVKLTAEGLPAIMAKILWRRDQLFGLAIENTFQFGELAQIIAAVQERYAMPEVTRQMIAPALIG